MTGNHWGILINVPSISATGNVISNNTVHANGRAGIAILGTNQGNTIQNNDATGNGLLNLAPTFRFDLFEAVIGGNIWRNNSGNANFTQASASGASLLSGESTASSGCIGGGQ